MMNYEFIASSAALATSMLLYTTAIAAEELVTLLYPWFLA